jgi:hypothetical protein
VSRVNPSGTTVRKIQFMVLGLGFMAQGLWFMVLGFGFRVLGFRVQGQGSGFVV